MKTINFKKFLLESEHQDDSSYSQIVNYYEGKNLAMNEIHELSEPNHSNFESSYRVGNVYFNNKDGIGAVPDNQNVIYKGFVCFLTPDEFLQLAASHRGAREQSMQDLKRVISEGYPIGAPFIDITLSDVDDGGYPTVLGHEGRARMLALKSLAEDGQMGIHKSSKFPVHFFLRDGLRARHINQKMLDAIKESGIIPEDDKKATPKTANKLKVVKELYLLGKHIEF